MVIMNGVEYSSSPKDGFPPIIYSDEEREVGVWRDGKPLYQKTINFGNLPNTEGKDVAHGISNLDRIVAYSAVTKNSNGTTYLPMPRVSDQSQYINDIYFTTEYIHIHSMGDRSSHNVFVTLQYTKTTDVAGSGKYTTYGGQTHHYSNEEKVVGTWFGKPLYERSWKLTMKNHSSHWISYTECAIPNLKEVCDVYYGLAGAGPRHYAYWDNNGTILFNVQTSSLAEFWIGSNNYTGQTLIYTVRYTKTTD